MAHVRHRKGNEKREHVASGAFAVFKDDHWVRPFLRQYRPTLLLALFLGVLTFFCASALMFTSGYLISRAAEMPGNIMLIYVPIVLTRAFGIGRPVVRYVERLTSHNWVLKMTSSLRVKLYTLLEKDAVFLSNLYKTGDLLGLLTEDIGHIQNLYLRTIFPTVVAWIVYVLVIVGLGLFSWWFALVMLLLLGIVVFLVPLVAVLHNGALQMKRSALKNELYSELTDNILGVSDWVISQRSSDYLAAHAATQKRLQALDNRLESAQRRRMLFVQSMFCLIVVAVLLWSGWYFGGEYAGAANWIAAFVLCVFPLIDAFLPLSTAALESTAYGDSLRRLNELCRQETTNLSLQSPAYDSAMREQEEADALCAALDTQESGADLSSKAHASDFSASEGLAAPFVLSADELSFKYPNGRMLLHKVNLTIEPGQKLALLGRSGSGKSTLAHLLRGDLIPTAGSVTLNGIATSSFGDDIARYIGVIQQQTYLFNTSLRNNLKLGRQTASDAELWKVLDVVGLKAMAEKLPQGLDTLVDEAGLRFSGGERHRIALARVLLMDVPLVILDEPTVGLDLLTEKEVLQTFFSAMQDKTVIMITHHLLGAAFMERVLFLEEGTIVLDGSPGELATSSHFYQNLLAFDQGGF